MFWEMHEAEHSFDELVARAATDGPQVVTESGLPTVVVVGIREYWRLTAAAGDFKAFLLSAPPIDDLVIERSQDTGRSAEF
jgi:prevent-host-death family protein